MSTAITQASHLRDGSEHSFLVLKVQNASRDRPWRDIPQKFFYNNTLTFQLQEAEYCMGTQEQQVSS